jgi:hypothetical protein
MTTTIGRASFSNAPSFLSWDGDALSLGINILPTTLAEAKALRFQLLGMLNNPDESVFPIVSTDDPDLDGFYTVTAVNVEPVDAYLTNKLMRCSLGLVRVANGYANPVMETFVVSRLATNSHGVLSTTNHATAAVSDSDDLIMDYSGIQTLLGTDETIDTYDGTTLTVKKFADTNVSGYYSQFAYPTGYYGFSSCMIEYSTDGSTWYQVVGRHIPNGVAWRISNGFIRFGTVATLPEDEVTIEVADANQYRGVGVTDIRGTFQLGGYQGPFVIRNSPEMVSIKVHCFTGVYITYTVWSGGTIVLLSFTSTTATGFLLEASTPDGTGTAVTGGIEKTGVDSNGNKMVLLSRSAVTATTASPWSITLTSSATSGVFSIGVNLSGAAAATSHFSAAGQLGQLCTPPQWRRRIAAR